MDQKFHFVLEALYGDLSFSQLCQSFGVSRVVGYKWLNRFRQSDAHGLRELSHAARRVWNKTPEEIERAIVELRKEEPHTGAEKILKLLESRFDPGQLPALSTANLILKRNGLVRNRRRIRRLRPVHPVFDPHSPNEIWSADFKGKFRMRNCQYCYPLTITDSFSRYILAAQGMYHPNFEGTKAVFEAVFRQYGLPDFIHTDNGAPFGCAQALGRLSHLAVWCIDRDVLPVYSDPAHPEQNGRHERMHRELKAQATHPPGADMASQQRKLNRFVDKYNTWRPHKALDLRTPAQLYTRSSREYTGVVHPWDYPSDMMVKRVCRNGAMRWGGYDWVVVSSTLIERYIGLQQITEGLHRVFYRNKLLGYFDEKSLKIIDGQGRVERRKKC